MTSSNARKITNNNYIFNLDKPLVLVGLMGSGKTALGSRLAAHLHLPFIDSDHEVEKQAGLSISDIFDIGGETKFRDLEFRVIRKLMTEKLAIIATGGGAFCQPKTREIIKAHAKSLWLESSPEILLHRIGDTKTRPLLNTGDPLETLTRLAAERQKDYMQADLRLTTGRTRHHTALRQLLALLEREQIIKQRKNDR